jgi:hypothetical protein
MIRRGKGLELMKIVFDLENYGFSKCGFNKSCSYICDRGHECIIYMI